MYQISQKLVLLLATSASITREEKEDKTLIRVLYINYPVWFQKDINNFKVILNLSSEVKVITPAYASKWDFCICLSNIDAKITDRYILATFKMVVTSFQIKD